jgi:nucleoside-diphosphate-sugar epimerase
MAHILVTGGTGFLGQHLVAALRKRGDRVRTFARSARPATLPVEVEHRQGDVRDAAALEAAFEGVDAAIHLVSNFRSAASDGEAHAINVEGTDHVLRAAQRQRVARLVHCSTIGVHGSVVEVPANEETPFNPGDAYQRTKLTAERRALQFQRDTGVPIAVVRPISLFGPGDERMLKLFRMIQKGRFVLLGDGAAVFQPAYVEDVVQGFLLCLERDAAVGEAFIVGGEEYLPLRDLVQRIAEHLAVAPPWLRLPMAPFSLAASACEAIFPPLGLEPPLHHRRLSFYRNQRAFRVDKAKRLLGFQPQLSLDQTLARTIAWYREAGWL